MPNKIKYTTTPTANTIKVGNFVLGIVTGVTYAPTSTTSFYNGYDVPSGGYVVYQNKATLGPSVFAPTGNTQMVNLTKSLGNATATTIYDSLKWINEQNTIIAVNREYENIVTSGLTMLLDAGFTPSYPLSGTSWTDLSFSGNNGTLINGPTFNSANGGSIVFDGTNDNILMPSTGVTISSGTNPWSASFWVNMPTPNEITSVYTLLGNSSSGVPGWFPLELGIDFDVLSVAVDSSNRVYVGGMFLGYSGVSTPKLFRLTSGGTLDTTFNTGVGISATNSVVYKILLSNYYPGRLYVAGSFTRYSGITVSRIVRLYDDGTLDTSFNVGASAFSSAILDVVEDSIGNLYIGGTFTTYTGSTNNKIIKLKPDGSKDTSFSTGLGFRFGTATNSTYYVRTLSLSSDGTKLYCGGDFTTYNSDTTNASYIARLNTSDGSLDDTFNMTTGANNEVYDILVSSGVTGDTIYVGGSFTSIVGSTQNRLARLTTGGTIDNSFNIGTGFNSVVHSLVEDSNKDLYVGGWFTTFTGSSNRCIIRLNSNGSKDTSFNNLGLSGFNSYVYTVFFNNTNNSVYAGGIFKTYSGRTVNRIAKLSDTGLLDTSFSNDSGVNLGYSTLSVNYYYIPTTTTSAANVYFIGDANNYVPYNEVISNWYNRWLFFTVTMSSGGTLGLHTYTSGGTYSFSGTSIAGSVVRNLSFTRIGASATSSNPFNGNMSQILCYNRELSTSEVQQIYNNTKSRYGL